MESVWIWFPLLAFVSGLVSSSYFFLVWKKNRGRPHYLLLWALGLFLMYWFQVPIILTNLGVLVTVTDFNFFFAITLPITFLALALMYRGVAEALGTRLSPQRRALLWAWFAFAAIFFSYHFIARKGVIEVYSLPTVGNLFFYIPLYFIIIVTTARWLLYASIRTASGVVGAIAVIVASALGIIRNFIIIENVLVYPPQFWYVVLTSTREFFALQTASIILFVLGFLLLHRRFRTLAHTHAP